MARTYLIKTSHDFIRSIRKAEDIFGQLLLIYMIYFILSLILQVYITLAVFFDFDYQALNNWKIAIMTSGSVGICIADIIGTAFMPEISNELVKRVRVLVQKFDEVIDDGSHEVMIHLEKRKPRPFFFFKKNIEDQLKNFDGIRVLDFFTIKRSLLISILAQFATFCIVLLQFKVAENANFGNNPKHLNSTIISM